MGYCRPFLQCVLKALNFVLVLCGLLMLLYSWWLYKEWTQDSAPSPSSYSYHPLRSDSQEDSFLHSGSHHPLRISTQKDSFDQTFATDHSKPSAISHSTKSLKLRFDWPDVDFDFDFDLPWFIYATFGAGAFIVTVTVFGACAAETHLACCLSFYQFGLILMLLFQAALAALIFFDTTWEKDLPDDPTGQEKKAREFIMANIEVCKWGALAVLIVELLALIIAMILRSMAKSSEYEEDDMDGPPHSQPGSRDPLLPRHYVNSGPPASPPHPPFQPSPGPPQLRSQKSSDAWRTRMLEKYGVDTNEFAYNSERQARTTELSNSRPTETRGGSCSIL